MRERGEQSFGLMFEEIQHIAGIPIDHSFLRYKKKLAEYGYQVEKIRVNTRLIDYLRAMGSVVKAFFRGKRYYVSVGGKRAPVLGHVGVSHTVIDVTDLECGPGTKVFLDAAPMFVPPTVPRQYIDG